MAHEALGIDLWGVVINTQRNSFELNWYTYGERIPLVEGAVDSIREIVSRRFGDEAYVISKCKEPTEEKLIQVLDNHDFFNRTGIESSNVYFCRGTKDKAPRCETLGITHFIDDRLEVLGYLSEIGVPNLFLLNPLEREVQEHKQYLKEVQEVENWYELADRLLK